MTFNIGAQHAGVINNVQGDMTINGGQAVKIGSVADALAVVRQLREALEATTLPTHDKSEAHTQLQQIERELEALQPDRKSIAARLSSLTRMLVSVGALANAGSALAVGVTSLASWLGRLGEPVQRMLTGS